MVIDENGVVTIKTLEGTEIRMLQVNEYGELIALEAGSPTEVLNGEGEWVPIPVSLGTLNGSGDAIFSQKVGIGTSTPTKELEISGDALIQGLLQANVLQAISLKLTGLSGTGKRVVIANDQGEIEVLNTANVNEVLNGEGNWVELSENFWEADGSGNITYTGDSVIVEGKLKSGEIESRNILVKSGNLAFMDSAEINAMGMKFYSFNDDTIPDMYVTGKLSGGNLDVPWTTLGPPVHLCLPGVFKNPIGVANPIAVSKGFSRLWSPSSVNGTVSLYFGSNGYNTIIDGSDNTPGDPTSTPLLINTYCGKDVKICTGNAGVVTVGKNFEAGFGVQRDLNKTVNIISGMTAHFAKTTHGGDYGYNSIIDVNRYKTKALAVQLGSVSPAEENFLVYGDGTTNIGGGNIPHTAQLSVASRTTIPVAEFISNHSQLQFPGLNTVINVDFDQTLAFLVKNRNITNNEEAFKIYGNGKTIIGRLELDPNQTNHTDALLQVGGKIVAKELRIIRPTFWWDSVFSVDYSLPSLEKVEEHIINNHHLPDVPSESEIMKFGYNLSEMDAILLKKIEELTLYIINQNKMIHDLNIRISNFSN